MKQLNNYILEKLHLNKDTFMSPFTGNRVFMLSSFTYPNKNDPQCLICYTLTLYKVNSFNGTELEYEDSTERNNERKISNIKRNSNGFFETSITNNKSYTLLLTVEQTIDFVEKTKKLLKHHYSYESVKELLDNYFDVKSDYLPDENFFINEYTNAEINNFINQAKKYL